MRSSEETLNIITEICYNEDLRFMLDYSSPQWLAWFEKSNSTDPLIAEFLGFSENSAAEAVNKLLDKVADDGR